MLHKLNTAAFHFKLGNCKNDICKTERRSCQGQGKFAKSLVNKYLTIQYFLTAVFPTITFILNLYRIFKL